MIMAYIDTSLGQYIYDKRKAKNLTQTDLLAQLASYGYVYSDTVPSQWENGRSVPPIYDWGFVKALAEILTVEPEDILRAAGFDLKYQLAPKWLQEFLDTATPEQLKMMRIFLETLKKAGE